ncbi:helix-turn-helix domain-containing protein [Vibrio parahaemolyticus]|nr:MULTISPECIES: helix-turn-helix domain-containing protein [Vibrio harveyi group]EGR1750532.1 helix-turn-helix domain-containing protein [Vibrio parahaemolyticus]EHH1242301.1 helix-turn-helix domain-containing protein [Vibrio parahaemolyticus]EKA7382778.1 helix-turn-helix domain-containing protein [Vibrio parahaemolyticus]ELB2078690.1 helix-turn-helix domain-containing protein [Vibrio parahaemolyticus]ELB2100155.1 helix-turn-helix domain-containing protein [Vibrio parahaemolyticus]
MTPKDFKRMREKLGCTPSEMAERLGVTYQAVKDWQSGRRKISRQIEKHLESLLIIKELEKSKN